jgi:hypothetical protein
MDEIDAKGQERSHSPLDGGISQERAVHVADIDMLLLYW